MKDWGHVTRAALKPIFDELSWSIKEDEAFKALMGDRLEVLRQHIASTDHDLALVRMLLLDTEKRVRPRYREAVRDLVVRLIPTKERSALLKATGFLASHLTNEGHSADYIVGEVRRKFLDNIVERCSASTVKSFINGIAEKRQDYLVLFGISKSTNSLLSNLSGYAVKTRDELPAHALAAISQWQEEYQYFLYDRVNAADPFQAALDGRKRLDDVKSLMIIPIQRLDISWSENAYVNKPRSNFGNSLIWKDTPLSTATRKNPVGRKLAQFTRIPTIIDSRFNATSRERIKSAISTAAIAFDSTRPESQLISLWSAFEILLSDPPETEARISHFVRQIIPCVCLRYHRRLFSAVHDQLAISYRKGIKTILSGVTATASSNQHTRFSKLIVMDDYETERASLLSLVADNPLALHRLYRLEKLYGTPDVALKTMQAHQSRVEWQLNRIYRARNNLVHAGRPSVFLEALVKNTAEYFRSSLTTLTRAVDQSGIDESVDQTIANVHFEWITLNARLKSAGKKSFDDDLAQFVFGAL